MQNSGHNTPQGHYSDWPYWPWSVQWLWGIRWQSYCLLCVSYCSIYPEVLSVLPLLLVALFFDTKPANHVMKLLVQVAWTPLGLLIPHW